MRNEETEFQPRLKRAVGRAGRAHLTRRAARRSSIITAALAHAGSRGVERICLFISWHVSAEEIRALLSNDRIASLGVKHFPSNVAVPSDLKSDPRISFYSGATGSCSFPMNATHVYFTGPLHLFSLSMLREAQQRETRSLAVYLGAAWCSVSGDVLNAAIRVYKAIPAPIKVALFRSYERFKQLSLSGTGHNRISLEQALRQLATKANPSSNFIPGRVVHMVGNLAPGGAERQVVYTVTGLSRVGLESVRVLCHHLNSGDRHHDFFFSTLQMEKIECREVRRNAAVGAGEIAPNQKSLIDRLPNRIANDVTDRVREFESLRPEIVHAWLDFENVRAGLAAVIAGVPRVVISGRNLNPRHFGFYEPFMDLIYRVLTSLPQVTIINNSRAGAADYADWLGLPRSRIGVIYNAVDFEGRSRLSRAEVHSLRESLGISPAAFVVGGMFRFQEEKRPFLWLESAALIARQKPEARFLVFGHGDLRNEMLHRAAALGITDRLTMPGLTKDVLSAMSVMDMMLLTSRGEGTPNVMLEAQWAGIPVVTTEAGGAREAIDPGTTGYVIETASARDIAQAVLKIAGDSKFRERALKAGPAFVEGKFGLQRMIRETTNIYAVDRSGAVHNLP